MKLLPRDFVETPEGLVFAVVAPSVADEPVLAFLRYVPHGAGRRKVDTSEANRLLREHYPHYLHHCRHRDAHLHAVPRAAVARHHRPREQVRNLLQRSPADDVESHLQRLLRLLVAQGVGTENIGVTGSVLIGEQHGASDIDLVIYDRATFFRVRAAVRRLIAHGSLHDLDESAWQEAYDRRGCALDLGEFLRHERRKGNKGMVAGRKFDIALVADTDASELETGWCKAGVLTLRARITDDRRSFDQPACYRLDHPVVGEIYSFTHTYVGQAFDGEWIEACGQLEIAPDGRRRLIVGSSREAPGEYLRVLWDHG